MINFKFQMKAKIQMPTNSLTFVIWISFELWALKFDIATSDEWMESIWMELGNIERESWSRLPLKSPFEQVPDEFGIGHPLNLDGSGHSRLRRDVRVWIHLQDKGFPTWVEAHVHPAIILASKEFKDLEGNVFNPLLNHRLQSCRANRFRSLIFRALGLPLSLISADLRNAFRKLGIIDFRDGKNLHFPVGL